MPSRKNLIYLTGFMGSGKSTIAPILAESLGYEFIDIDAEIEKRAGETISEIFHRHGEQYFRNLEREILLRVSQQDGSVISLGGGTIANRENLAAVKSSGVLIYLKTELEQIMQRLRDKTDRPMLETLDGSRLSEGELRTRITELLNVREPFYSQADITIATNNKRVQTAVEEILSQIKKIVE